MQPDNELRGTVVRRAFASWSIRLPASLKHAFLHDEGYWHAWDERRSVSLSSFELTDESGPVAAERILQELPRPDGLPLADRPSGLLGWVVEADAPPPSVASRCLSGMLAVDGRVLLVTITSDDSEWATRTWCSIRSHLSVRSPEAVPRSS